ncbi:hypothetical protein C5167_020111, partial [Papaver somniferum]
MKAMELALALLLLGTATRSLQSVAIPLPITNNKFSYNQEAVNFSSHQPKEASAVKKTVQ